MRPIRCVGMSVLGVMCLGTAIFAAEKEVTPTSVSQIKDVSEKAPYYRDLQALVEKWSIVRTDKELKFNPDAAMTRGDLAILLNDALNAYVELLMAGMEAVPEKGRDKILPGLMPQQLGTVTSVSELKDVAPTHKAYEAVRSLVERYGIGQTTQPGTFGPGAAITGDDLAALLKGPLGYTGKLPEGKEAVKRGEAASYLAKALDAMTARVDAAIAKAKK